MTQAVAGACGRRVRCRQQARSTGYRTPGAASQVWAMDIDITHVPMARSWRYFTVVRDWYSRKVLVWCLRTMRLPFRWTARAVGVTTCLQGACGAWSNTRRFISRPRRMSPTPARVWATWTATDTEQKNQLGLIFSLSFSMIFMLWFMVASSFCRSCSMDAFLG